MDPFGNSAMITPATHHEEGHRMDSRRFGNIQNAAVFHYKQKQQPTPGALSYAFESLALPEFSPIGPGVHPKNLPARSVTQPQQSYMPTTAVTIAGYGGVIAGQYMFQPLYDPNTNSYGGVPLIDVIDGSQP